MTVEYQIIPNLRLVYVEMRKALSFEELVAHLEDLAADKNYVPPMKKIVDFTSFDNSPMPSFTFENFTMIESYYNHKLRGEHCVFVTPSEVTFGMGRLFDGHMYSANLEVSVVRSLDSALALLGIKEEEFRTGQRAKA
ncbi:MAG: hypothetical protein V1797_01040 [Pseudomonadota bacterium]